VSNIYYTYCATNFVVATSYEVERFGSDISEKNQRTLFDTTKNHLYERYGIKIDEPIKGFPKSIIAKPESITDYLDKKNSTFIYDPLNDAKDLYLQLNKIDLTNEKSLIKFVSEYGLPLNEYYTDTGEIFYSDLFLQNEREKFCVGLEISRFYEKLAEFKYLVKMWDNIRNEYKEKLKVIRDDFARTINYYELNGQQPSAKEKINSLFLNVWIYNEQFYEKLKQEYLEDKSKLKEIDAFPSNILCFWNEVQNLSPIDFCKSYLSLKLNNVSSGHPSTKFAQGKIVPAIRFNNLLEVAYYQFKQAIFMDMAFDNCLNCDALFEPVHGHQKFCSPLPNRKRSTCENTYNQRMKRKRLKEKN
jgi:hypothetical protein